MRPLVRESLLVAFVTWPVYDVVLVPRDKNFYKVNIFISAIPRLTKDTCQTFLKGLGFGELSKFFDKRRGRKNYTKVSNLSRILDEFKLKGWIYDYHDDKRNKDKFEVLKNKPRIQ